MKKYKTWGGGSIKKVLEKDIKEINKIKLSIACLIFIMLIGIIAYKTSMMYSYAIFTDSIVGEKTIELSYIPERTKEFKYTGNYEEYEVPNSGYYYIELGGAGEENIYGYGQGAITSGYIKLEKGDKLYFYVGGKHNEFNGGGASNVAERIGNGATDVRLESGKWDNINSLLSRIMVAGAGGNQSNRELGTIVNNTFSVSGDKGSGGSLFGISGKYYSLEGYPNVYAGEMGRQTSGGAGGQSEFSETSNGYAGSFGKGGEAGICYHRKPEDTCNDKGYGGSGGYYGSGGSAGGSYQQQDPAGTAGGSSYISGYAGVNSVDDNTTITHTNDTLHYSGKYFIGGEMLEGQNSGNGYAKITYVGEKPKRKDDKLDNVRYIKNCINSNTSYYKKSWWREFQAIYEGKNIAKDKKISGTATEEGGNFTYETAVDGNIDGYYAITKDGNVGNACITVDLGANYDLDEVAVIHDRKSLRVHFKNITSVSSDNIKWTEVINETNTEENNGMRVNAYRDHINGYIQDGLVLWYDGYANTGEASRSITTKTWKDLSGNDNNLTISGDPSWKGDNLQFNGSEYAYKEDIDYKITNNEYTLEVVTMPTSSAGGDPDYPDYQKIFSSYWAGMWVYKYINLMFDGGLKAFTSSTADAETTDIKIRKYIQEEDLNKKYSLTTVLKGQNLIGYLGNTMYQSNSFNFIPKDITSDVYVGGGGTNVLTYKGRIYSIRVYNRALTEEELLHNYNLDKLKYNLNN